ncbi:MAG: hypothetical protein QXN37_01625 [Candidatus Anstonellaceae archaeon]
MSPRLSQKEAVFLLEKFMSRKDAEELTSRIINSKDGIKKAVARELPLFVSPSPFYRYLLEDLTGGLLKTPERKIAKILYSLDPNKKEKPLTWKEINRKYYLGLSDEVAQKLDDFEKEPQARRNS